MVHISMLLLLFAKSRPAQIQVRSVTRALQGKKVGSAAALTEDALTLQRKEDYYAVGTML